ncbi:MAD-domain-containing protein [Trametopsis cervina]|nr:MAD-domain-containing protein [Trametopsis cervina]
MNQNDFTTPVNRPSRLTSSLLRSSAPKRDSLAAELERDPQLSTAKRQQRAQVFTSHMAHASLERQLLAAQTAKTELETKLREKDIELERLRGDRDFLAEREAEERAEKERERAEYDEDKRKSDSDLRVLRKVYTGLQDELASLKDEHTALQRRADHAALQHASQAALMDREIEMLNAQLAEVRSGADARVEQLQAQLNDLDVGAVRDRDQSKKDADEETWAILRAELHGQANHMRAVEAENARMAAELTGLRQRQANVEILKEQKRELEVKALGTDKLREQVARLEAELDAARREREDWASRSSSTPVSVTKSLSELRLSHARLVEEHVSTTVLLRRREKELAEAVARITETEAAVEKLKQDLDVLKDKAERQEHLAQLAERDVGFLRAMVASLEAEQAAEDGAIVDETTAGRVQHLEALVSEYRATIEKMEKKIDDLGGDPSSFGGAVPRSELLAELESAKAAAAKAQQALEELETASASQLDQIETLEQTLFELRGEVGAGRHLPPGVRVLSLRDNPAQQWADLGTAAMERLKRENAALLERLRELEADGARGEHDRTEERGGAAGQLVPRESWEAVCREKEELEAALGQKEKRLLRLQQVFSAKSEEFKAAIASILGVKLAFYPNGQVRVTSQFDLNAAFVFQPAGKGGDGMRMQLVAQGDGGPAELPQLMHYWVEQEQCIPGFLASVTLECYEKNKSGAV